MASLSVGAGDVGVRVDVLALAARANRGLQTRLALTPSVGLTITSDHLQITTVGDGQMTRRSFILREHAVHRRKLRAPARVVTNTAKVPDNAARMRIGLRTNRENSWRGRGCRDARRAKVCDAARHAALGRVFLRAAPPLEGALAPILSFCAEHGMPGVIAKQKDAPYSLDPVSSHGARRQPR